MNQSEKEKIENNLANCFINAGIVFSGKLKDLYKVLEFIESIEGTQIVYKRATRDKIYIKTKEEL